MVLLGITVGSPVLAQKLSPDVATADSDSGGGGGGGGGGHGIYCPELTVTDAKTGVTACARVDARTGQIRLTNLDDERDATR